MYCPVCHTENNPAIPYCRICASPLLVECPQCGLENDAGLSSCKYCGSEVSGATLTSFMTSFEGERRFVVAFFADIAGFTRLSEKLDAESATLLVNQCLDEMTKIIVQKGGRLIRYTGDGLLAVFGAPTSYEDDLERALRAALEMRNAINQLVFGENKILLHIGIACGVVVAGGVGSRGRKEYNIIGRAVNIASRLEEISDPNQILVTDEIARLTSNLFSFKKIKSPQIKGAEKVVAFELVSALTKTAPLNQITSAKRSFVGRSQELDLLKESVSKLTSGQGKNISIIGDPGTGKSRILFEIYTWIKKSHPDKICLLANATESSNVVDYKLYYSLLRHAMGFPRNTGISDLSILLRGYLEEYLPEYVDEFFPFFAHILGIPLPKRIIEQIGWLNEQELMQRISNCTKIWMHSLANQRGLVLLYDNIHGIDEQSASIWRNNLKSIKQAPIVNIFTARPDFTPSYTRIIESVSELSDSTPTDILLEPFTRDETELMIRNILEGDNISSILVDAVSRRSEGNPLYIEELLHVLIEQKFLTQDQYGKWHISLEWEQVPMPPSIQGILQARIDRLDQTTRRILQIASAIGHHINMDIMKSVSINHGLDESIISSTISNLLDLELLEATSTEKDELRFKHIRIHDTVYNNMLKQNKAEIISSIVGWYEENTINQKEPPYSMIAQYLEATEDVERKIHYFAQAGHQAARFYSNNAARTYFDKALTLVEDPVMRFGLLEAREIVCSLIGDFNQQKSDLNEMLQYSLSSDDFARTARTYNRLAIWYESQSDYISAKSFFEKGMEAAHKAGDHPTETESLHHLASTSWRLGIYDDALQFANTAWERVRYSGDLKSKSICLTTLGVIHRTLGDTDKARNFYEEAIRLHRNMHDQRGEAINLSQLGNVLFDLGDYWQALDHHKNALSGFQKVGDRRGEAWSLSGIGTVYLTCGNSELALINYEEALSIRQTIGDLRGEGVVLADIGNALFAQGDSASAIEKLRNSSRILKKLEARRDEEHTLRYLAYVLEHAGEYDEARSIYQKLNATYREGSNNEPDIDSQIGLIRIAFQQNEIDQAIEKMEVVLDWIDNGKIESSEFPLRALLVTAKVLESANRHIELQKTLDYAKRLLHKRAEKINDGELRESYLNNVPENLEILRFWTKYRRNEALSTG